MATLKEVGKIIDADRYGGLVTITHNGENERIGAGGIAFLTALPPEISSDLYKRLNPLDKKYFMQDLLDKGLLQEVKVGKETGYKRTMKANTANFTYESMFQGHP
jgi:hypothetical protein